MNKWTKKGDDQVYEEPNDKNEQIVVDDAASWVCLCKVRQCLVCVCVCTLKPTLSFSAARLRKWTEWAEGHKCH